MFYKSIHKSILKIAESQVCKAVLFSYQVSRADEVVYMTPVWGTWKFREGHNYQVPGLASDMTTGDLVFRVWQLRG